MRVARSGSAQQYFGLIKGESVNQRADHVIVSGGLSFFVKIGKILPVHVENIRCRGVQLGQIRQDARSSRRHPTGQRVRLMLTKEERQRILHALAEDCFDWYGLPRPRLS